MSLKARIEAVLYAAEEPVTLAQLVALLSQQAQAELDAAAALQAELPLDAHGEDRGGTPEAVGEAGGDADALNAEVLDAVPALEREEAESAKPADAMPADGEADAQREKADAQQEKVIAQQAARDVRDYLRAQLDALMKDYAEADRGIEVREVAGGFRFATKPEYHDAVRGFVKQLKPPLKLTLQALETLAVIAYKQPVTAPEISEVRGVDSGGVLGSLMTRKLIQTAGRKQVIGRPMLYKTTREFLVRFGLKDVAELPSIEEFEKMAGELIHDDEEMAMANEQSAPVDEQNHSGEKAALLHDTPADMLDDKADGASGHEAEPSVTPQESAAVEPEADEHAPQADGTP